MSLSAAAFRDRRTGDLHVAPVKAASQIWQGGVVLALAGVAIAGRAATTRAELDTMRVLGVAEHDVLGGGSDGDVDVTCRKGIVKLANSGGGDALADADVGNLCFLVDDAAVGKTIGGGVRPIAGEVVEVVSDGVWVDLAKACGPRRVYLQFAINQTDTLAPTNADLVSPVVGAVTQLQTIVQVAVTTGGDVTGLVGATAIDGLACTVADGATKGTVVTDTPTPGHASTVVAVDSRIQVAPGAAFTTAGAVSGLVEITY